MAKYRKKPVIIDAITVEDYIALNFDGFDGFRIYTDNHGSSRFIKRTHSGDALLIGTMEGEMLASPGDWIITGVSGERYPCKPDIFEMTYEIVNE